MQRILLWGVTSNGRILVMFLRAALHLEAGPIPLEANCMKFQPFLGWRPASTTHYNKIIKGPIFPYVKAFGSRSYADSINKA
jgi:hypothetical protein